jgi:hypothetical protein
MDGSCCGKIPFLAKNLCHWLEKPHPSCRSEQMHCFARRSFPWRSFPWQFLSVLLFLGVLAGCTRQQDPQELRKKTADATANAKSDAKAVAEGIHEGLTRDKRVDLNTATRDQLLSLPDLTGAEADRIIAARPINDPGDLVTRRIVSKAEYDKIADHVTATR